MKIPEDGNLSRITSSGPNPRKLVIVKVPDKFQKHGESVYQLSSLNPDTAGDEWPADEYIAKLFPNFYKERKEVKTKVYEKMYTKNKQMSSERRGHNPRKRYKPYTRGKKSWSDKKEHQQKRSAADIDPWLNRDQLFHPANSTGETYVQLYGQPYNYPANANIYQNTSLQLASNQMQQSLCGSNLSCSMYGSTLNDKKQSFGLLGDAPSHIIPSDRPSTSGYSARSVDPLPVNSQFNNSYRRWENGCDSVSQPQHMASNQRRNNVNNSRREYYGKGWNLWNNTDRNAMHRRPFRGKRNMYPRK